MTAPIRSILFAGLVSTTAIGSAHAATLLTTVNVNATTPGGLQTTVDGFRTELGANNGNDPVNADPQGRRQINWDAAPAAISDPNPFPGDFFNFSANPRARGIEFSETGDTESFLLSSDADDPGAPAVRFGLPTDFVPFSEERLFSPVGGTTFDILFFDPATQTNPALSRGLGIVFSDVEVAGVTTLRMFDIDNNEVFNEVAESGDSGGLTFVGGIFDDAVIARASVNVGNAAFFGNADVLGDDAFGPGSDGVVVDDVIFGEPVPLSTIPLPAGLVLMLSALGGIAVAGRRAASKA